MTTIAPGLLAAKPRRTAGRTSRLDDDPTEYPSGEPLSRECNESEIVRHLQPVLIRYQAERGVVCYVGSDNFIYWVKGNNKMSVSPDLYVLLGILPTAHPALYEGSKEDGCWKTWIHDAVPNFALEVKARRNARKDELQSPARHDALGTKELIVFDPYAHRRRFPRKRFCVQRRNEAGRLVVVAETNDDRVYSEQLEAFLVSQGEGGSSRLRLGLGSNGERLCPFESERVEMEARRADDEARMRQEEARMRQEEAQRADNEARMREEESRRADNEARMREEQTRRADDLAAELERLRASMGARSKRSAKTDK